MSLMKGNGNTGGNYNADKFIDTNGRHFYSLFVNLSEGAAVYKLLYEADGNPADYLIAEVNAQYETIFKHAKAEIIDKPATEVFRKIEPPYLNIFANVVKNNLSVKFETYDPVVEKYLNLAAFSIGGGFLMVLFSDMTEKKEMTAELRKALDKSEEANRLKASLLSNLSHEFRTPMTGILGMSSILKEKLKDPENLTMLDYIIASGNRLMKTLNAILELAEEESNIKNRKLIYLQSAAEPIINEYMAKAEQKGLRFKYDVYDSRLAVLSTERVLSQVFLHLIDNAVKFTEQGVVEITVDSEVTEDNYWAKITIRDTGIGIMPKDQQSVFYEFRQVSEGISRCFEGVGLGLTLVKKMVDLMKGRIELESQLGKGSLFTVYLPAEKIENEKDLIQEPEVKNIGCGTEKNKEEIAGILLVEDNLINVKVTQVYLKDDYNLDYARTGVQAVKMAKEKQYSLVLMDINLGVGMDGIKTAKAIKAIEGYQKIPIVALTGYAMESDKEKLFTEGLTHHLSKPFDKNTLIDFVETALAEA